jgi:hypothetical protein
MNMVGAVFLQRGQSYGPWDRCCAGHNQGAQQHRCTGRHVEIGALAGQILGDNPLTVRCIQWEEHTIEIPDGEALPGAFVNERQCWLALLRMSLLALAL